MEIIDISWPISAKMTAYKDHSTVEFVSTRDFKKDNVRETTITLSTHSGTHVDAPAHFMRDGHTIDQLAPEHFIGPCTVLDLTHVKDKITAQDLKGYALEEGDSVLLKTTNSALKPTAPFDQKFVYLDASGAEHLAKIGVMLVGIDYLGIERGQPDHDTHLTLMEHEIAIVEGLRLEKVKQGQYLFVCLPLKLVGLEAAPARAVLVTDI